MINIYAYSALLKAVVFSLLCVQFTAPRTDKPQFLEWGQAHVFSDDPEVIPVCSQVEKPLSGKKNLIKDP